MPATVVAVGTWAQNLHHGLVILGSMCIKALTTPVVTGEVLGSSKFKGWELSGRTIYVKTLIAESKLVFQACVPWTQRRHLRLVEQQDSFLASPKVPGTGRTEHTQGCPIALVGVHPEILGPCLSTIQAINGEVAVLTDCHTSATIHLPSEGLPDYLPAILGRGLQVTARANSM
jgi:hypothetical protein